jgi:hypothetical protein
MREATILIDIKRSFESLPQGQIVGLKKFCHPNIQQFVNLSIYHFIYFLISFCIYCSTLTNLINLISLIDLINLTNLTNVTHLTHLTHLIHPT